MPATSSTGEGTALNLIGTYLPGPCGPLSGLPSRGSGGGAALSPARRCPTASDLPLGLGNLLPSLLQIHGWEVAGDLSFPARWATLEAQAIKGLCSQSWRASECLSHGDQCRLRYFKHSHPKGQACFLICSDRSPPPPQPQPSLLSLGRKSGVDPDIVCCDTFKRLCHFSFLIWLLFV